MLPCHDDVYNIIIYIIINNNAYIPTYFYDVFLTLKKQNILRMYIIKYIMTHDYANIPYLITRTSLK